MREEECERGVEMRTELEKKASELLKHQNRDGITKRAEDVERGKNENRE